MAGACTMILVYSRQAPVLILDFHWPSILSWANPFVSGRLQRTSIVFVQLHER